MFLADNLNYMIDRLRVFNTTFNNILVIWQVKGV